MLQLPPLKDNSTFKNVVCGQTDLDDSDYSWDEKTSKAYYHLNLNAIDFTSMHFKNLPAEVRRFLLAPSGSKGLEKSLIALSIRIYHSTQFGIDKLAIFRSPKSCFFQNSQKTDLIRVFKKLHLKDKFRTYGFAIVDKILLVIGFSQIIYS